MRGPFFFAPSARASEPPPMISTAAASAPRRRPRRARPSAARSISPSPLGPPLFALQAQPTASDFPPPPLEAPALAAAWVPLLPVVLVALALEAAVVPPPLEPAVVLAPLL